MPSAPPSCRTALKVPAALPIDSGGTEVITELCWAGMAIVVPTPAITSAAIEEA